MTVRLSRDLEQFGVDAVRSGLYAREDDVIRDALTRLRQAMPPAPQSPARKTRTTRLAKLGPMPITPEELNRRLLATGLVTQLPDPAEDADDAEDLPIETPGEPLSETIIRERC